MRIDIAERKSWTAASEKYREWLAEDLKDFAEPALQVQVYRGYSHALLESIQGLARLFSHKKTIAIVGNEPSFEELILGISGEGFNIQHFTIEQIENPETIAPLERELLLVLFAEDDPVTGKLLGAERIQKALKGKRIFQIALSHAAFRADALKRPLPFDVRILSLTPEKALVIAGERFRISPQLAPRMPWEIPSQGNDLRDRHADLSQMIKDFEKNLPVGFSPYFKEEEARLFDRAVIVHQGIDGSALIDELAAQVKRTLPTAGAESSLETSSPCRWNDTNFTDWLLKRGEAEESVRGLIVIDANLVAQPNFKDQLAAAAKTILEAQG